MTDEKPTGEAGASISERIEAVLSAGEENQQQESGQAAPEKPEAVEAPEGDAPDVDEGPQLELSDVAKVLGIEESLLDVDEDGALKIKTKIDGVEGAAKLNDFIKSYQLQGHIDAKVRQVAEQEKQLTERVGQYEQIARTKLQELDLTAQMVDQLVMQDFQGVDWNNLIHSDPLDYQAKRHAYEQKAGLANQFKQAVQQQHNHVRQILAEKDALDLQQAAKRLLSMIPEWSDQKVREGEVGQLREWLQSRGADPRTLEVLRDPGLVVLLREKFKAEKQAPQVAAVEKKVRAAPKLVRPGQSVDKNQRQAESVRGLKEDIRKSGGKSGIAEYLIATGKV